MLKLKACNFIKKETLAQWRRCFPVNFVKFLKTPFSIEYLWWLLLAPVSGILISYFSFLNPTSCLYVCFVFRFPINISKMLVRGGDTVQIPVNRAKGLNDRVEVKWECSISMKNDAIPNSGVIKFEQVTPL